MKNLGKQFEQIVHQAFSRVPDVSIDRLRDAPRKLKGVDNPSDFIVYKKPHELYVECKSHKGNTFPFSCVREEQWNGMLNKSEINGVMCGILIWFIDHDITVWIDITDLYMWKYNHKSLNVKDLDAISHIVIQGRKKRVYFEYSMDKFLEELYE